MKNLRNFAVVTVAALAALVALPACSTTEAETEEPIEAEEITQDEVSDEAASTDPDDTNLTDEEITTAVVTQLLVERGAPAREITVETNDGIVRLNGAVDAILHRERAEDIAARIKGVRGIINQIEVNAPEVADAKLRSDVELALAEDPATDSFEIGVLAEEGDVVLTGEVESWAEATLAATVAGGVNGVESVTNDIVVNHAKERTESAIQKEIRRRMAWDSRVDSAAIEVSVDDGVVTLIGDVGSLYEAGVAQSLAWVRGVDQVKAGNLEVAWWERDRMIDRDVLEEKSDEAIADAVRDALLYDPRVLSFEISVVVDDGEVTLAGTVDNLRASEVAAETAANVHGVWEVNNMLKIEPPFEEYVDATITEAVERKLLNDGVTRGFEIAVRTQDGEVTLSGLVGSAFEARKARDIAATTPGVTSVDNNIEIERPNLAQTNEEPVTDASIAQRIRDHIFWSPMVDSEDLVVTVDDGVATLSGTVDTWNARRVAIENARVGGAVAVEADELKVSYGPAKFVPEGGIAY